MGYGKFNSVTTTENMRAKYKLQTITKSNNWSRTNKTKNYRRVCVETEISFKMLKIIINIYG